ncbi:mechanosensitive ion channel family protein [Salinispira pacifica]|uniref:Small-conductance mechanosensitive channel n=1 Tax=Salinispira pacifica TaxID=1307761 RepID=V5WH89_9SPIO|nr:mechanosensitive ion channel family protein [Salinispira pacifica]AHC14511.1 Small-conductance mechanosensitive channel [Salinispira pacifica]
MTDLMENILTNLGLSVSTAVILEKSLFVLAVLLLSWLADIISKKVLLKVLTDLTRKTAATWDDIIVRRGVFKNLAHFAPALVLYFLLPAIFTQSGDILAVIQRIILVYMVGVTVLVLDSLLSAVQHIYQGYEVSKNRPIKGYIQVGKIVLYAIGMALMITTLLNRSPLGLLSGIGALSAVIMLVFRDSILGLVSSIQLTANNLIRIGDWIEVPQFGADGDVVDITLQTVKVQNFDKTIVTFPIYALTSSSFRNWRGMAEAGGRRIKRAISMDINTIRFLTEEEMDNLQKISLISSYLKQRRQEISEHRSEDPPGGGLANTRRLTNIGTFRAHVAAYLSAHPQISNEMTFLVRQLPPGPTGLPIEIYVFSRNTIWAIYESIQADIFDHLLAVAPEFGLRVYQQPGSYDMSRIFDSVHPRSS